MAESESSGETFLRNSHAKPSEKETEREDILRIRGKKRQHVEVEYGKKQKKVQRKKVSVEERGK